MYPFQEVLTRKIVKLNSADGIGRGKLPRVVRQEIFGLGKQWRKAVKVPKTCVGWVIRACRNRNWYEGGEYRDCGMG